MKKRFIRLFMFATALASMGALNSCKDYDEDRINDLEHRLQDSNASLTEQLNAQVGNLQSQIDALNAAISQIKSCTCPTITPCSCGDIDAKIAAALAGLTPGISAAEALQIANQAIADYMAAHPGLTAAEVDHMIQTALAGIKSCTCTGDDLTTAQVSDMIAQALAAYLAAHPDGITAAQVQDMINTSLQGYATISDLTDAKTALEEAYKAADTALKNELLEQMSQALQTVNTAIATAQAKADDAYALAQTAKDNAQAAAEAAGAADQKAQSALDKATANETTINNINTQLSQIEINLTKAQQDATAALTQAQTNATLIDGLSQTLTTLATKDEVAQADKNLQDQINKLAEEIKNFATQEDIVATLRYAMDLYNEACQYTDETAQELQNQINALLSKVEATQTAIETVINKKLNNLMNRATSIVLQGTKNPVYGTFALPFGIQSNVLIALHGENTKGAQKFPLPEYFPNATYETIKANATLLSDAGKVYLTINPNEVDFAGQTLTLENSNGEASLFKLSPLTNSDKTIKFGQTRGAAGFYEATVSVDKSNIEDVNLGIDPVETANSIAKDGKTIANALLNYVEGKSHSGVAASAQDLANVIDEVLKALSMDALAVKGSWSDDLGNHSITSNYGIAATALRPLNFTSLDALDGRTNVPGYGRTMNLVNRVYNKAESIVNNALNGINFSTLSMTSIHFNDTNAANTYTVSYHGSVTAPVSVTIPANDVTISGSGSLNNYDVTIYDPDHDGDSHYIVGVAHITGATATVSGSNSNAVTINTSATSSIDIDIDITSTINSIMHDANSSLGDINNIIDNINDMIAEIDNATNKITTSAANLQSSLNTWMNRLNNLGTRVLNKIPQLTKPAMIVVSDYGTTLAGFRGHAPVVTGKVTLIPTTYSLEYLAPIYKKYVTVNGQPAEIGEDGKIENVTLQKGINEIRYAALDYAGNQEVRIYEVYAQ